MKLKSQTSFRLRTHMKKENAHMENATNSTCGKGFLLACAWVCSLVVSPLRFVKQDLVVNDASFSEHTDTTARTSAHTHTCTCAQAYVHTRTYSCAHVHACTRICAHARRFAYRRTQEDTYICMRAQARTHTRAHTHACARTHARTRSHPHKNKQLLNIHKFVPL